MGLIVKKSEKILDGDSTQSRSLVSVNVQLSLASVKIMWLEERLRVMLVPQHWWMTAWLAFVIIVQL